jgi:tetratricopeptide (TPR) repeat protein
VFRRGVAKREAPSAARRSVPNATAYDLYLRGLAAATEVGSLGPEPAVRFFEEATRRDPEFADAFAAWADLYVAAAGDTIPMREAIPRARTLVARALALDPNSSDAHSALANITFQSEHDWPRAEAEFRTAIALNPSNAMAHQFFGMMLIPLARFEEATEVLRRAFRLDPATRSHRRTIGWAELEAGHFEAAIAIAEEERDAEPQAVQTHTNLGFFYLSAGRRADALREADTPLTGANEVERYDHALLNALVGRPESARALVLEIEQGGTKSYTSAMDLAILYAALGDRARAFDQLDKDLREGDSIFWLYYRGIFFHWMRQDPRFTKLLREYRLPLDPPVTAAPPFPTGT